MSTNEEQKALAGLRTQLDEIDNSIVELLGKRAELVLEVRKTKKKENISVYSPSREKQIINRVLSLAGDSKFPLSQLERIFINIIGASRSLIGDISVSFLGPAGSFAMDAALKQFGEAIVVSPEISVEDVVAKVSSGESTFGILPRSTSGEGVLFKSFEALIDTELSVIAEVFLHQKLSLCSSADDLAQIRSIYGSAPDIANADSWLRSNVAGANLLLETNMARVADLSGGERDIAFLLPEATASRLGLKVLISGIQDEKSVDASYMVIGAEPALPTGDDQTSVLFAVAEKPGILRELLEPFSKRGISLLKIESKPSRSKASNFLFYTDLLGHTQDQVLADAISELGPLCEFVKVLGSYPRTHQ